MPILLVLFLTFFIVYPKGLVGPPSKGAAEVTGTVTDFAGARVADATLQFSDGRDEYVVKTSSDGTYSLHLPEGSYMVKVTSIGFCPMSRARFLLRTDSVVKLDFELILCAYDLFRLPYDEEQLVAPDASGLRPLAQFGCRREHGAVEYTGLVQQGTYIRPVVTYNVWALRANSITYDRTAQTLTGEGNVVWQDGKTTKLAQFIQIHLRNPPEIKMLKGPS